MINCKTCDEETLTRKKKYRFSAIVVFIGYLILIPSFIGIVTGGIMCIGAGAAATQGVDEGKKSAGDRMDKAGIPQAIASKILAIEPVTELEREGLSEDQRTELALAQ